MIMVSPAVVIAGGKEAALGRGRATRQPAAYTDVTVSFSKSISVLHASIRENERRARQAADTAAVAYWAGREHQFQEILQRANRAALGYLQTWAGITRSGYHGNKAGGREPGRFEEAGLVVTSWLQGTSRDGDPQDHIHNQIARITHTHRDGAWRALDTMSLRAVLGALQAVAATAVECELTAAFGVEWIPRADGRGNEIKGVTQAQLDAYSTRTVQVREKERELARAWARKHGRAPTARELLHIASDATLQSRAGKDRGAIDWDALARRWDATLGGQLAGIAPAVSNSRGPDVPTREQRDGLAPGGPPSREAQERALAKALALVSDQHPAWTRHELLKQLAQTAGVNGLWPLRIPASAHSSPGCSGVLCGTDRIFDQLWHSAYFFDHLRRKCPLRGAAGMHGPGGHCAEQAAWRRSPPVHQAAKRPYPKITLAAYACGQIEQPRNVADRSIDRN